MRERTGCWTCCGARTLDRLAYGRGSYVPPCSPPVQLSGTVGGYARLEGPCGLGLRGGLVC